MTKFKMNFRIVMYLCFVLSVEVFSKREKIINGENTTIRQFPSVVSLKVDNKHVCGGVIIGKRHVLTAAHCLAHNDPVNNLKIYAGSVLRSGVGAIVYNILRIDVHPDYTGEMKRSWCLLHDISVITLRESIVYNEFINKVHLPILDVSNGVRANMTGWGAISYPNVRFSPILQKLTVSVLMHKQCSKHLKYRLRKQQICAFERYDAGSCTGDSGSPLIRHGTVVGVFSFLIPCAVGVPDVYTNIYYYVDYIRSVMRDPIS